MWDLPGPGLEPVSPALAGGFLTTAQPGKSHVCLFFSLVQVAFLLLMLSTVYLVNYLSLFHWLFFSIFFFSLSFI